MVSASPAWPPPNQVPVGMFKLVISDDEGKTTVVPLVRDEITIGRKEGNTIRLTERNVSRRHAKLKKANGAFLVEDLSSYNGVKVNGRRIERETHLKAGDQISIGDYLLALQVEAQQQAEAAGANGGAHAAPTAALDTIPTAVPSPLDAQTAMISAPAEPTPPARLVMLTPPAPGAEFAISRPRLRLGRAEDLDVWVNHRSISREHAEVVNDNGQFRITDLGSANGMRVNGADTRQAVLSPGDVVELGQVRFRFVAPGETYFFEADRTVQMEAITGGPGASRVPLLAGGLIVLAGVIAGAVIAFTGGDEETPAVATLPPQTGQAMPIGPAPAPSASPALDALATRCRTELGAGRFNEAINAANAALAQMPEHADARQCKDAASAQLADATAFDRGVQALRAGDVSTAYYAFEEMQPASPLRQRPEVAQTIDRFARQHLAEGSELVRTNPSEAIRHANEVLVISAVSPALRAEAQQLLDRARSRSGGGGGGSAALQRPNNPDRGTGGGGRTPTKTTGGGGRPDPQQGGGGDNGGGGGGGGDQGGGASPMERAAEAMARGDQNGVVRALEGRTTSARELALLIETYRTLGNQRAACRNMDLFTRRYPTARQANNYRQMLAGPACQ